MVASLLLTPSVPPTPGPRPRRPLGMGTMLTAGLWLAAAACASHHARPTLPPPEYDEPDADPAWPAAPRPGEPQPGAAWDGGTTG